MRQQRKASSLFKRLRQPLAAAVVNSLTIEEQVIADFTANVTQTLAAEGQTEVSVQDLFSLLLADTDLVAQLQAQGWI